MPGVAGPNVSGMLRRFVLGLVASLLAGVALGYQAITDVDLADLPREARETVALIRADGPFPYRKDGVTFGNRERLLPAAPRGYYREYTVPTPGARDRGARRIVAGRDGELYYSDDHYRTFRRILE
ncbi:MAG TPA: ribonuclease domain-containing protein [Burkholderiales bacterium]|nr:ribonuclease domain-containing protein [Burkholderiales bacterium]